MKNKLGNQMRKYPTPKDYVRVHMNKLEQSLCGIGPTLYEAQRLSKDQAQVSCKTCQRILSKLQ